MTRTQRTVATAALVDDDHAEEIPRSVDAEVGEPQGADPWTRFRCRCGRSVATPRGSAAADQHLCSRCRERELEQEGFSDLVREDR